MQVGTHRRRRVLQAAHGVWVGCAAASSSSGIFLPRWRAAPRGEGRRREKRRRRRDVAGYWGQLAAGWTGPVVVRITVAQN